MRLEQDYCWEIVEDSVQTAFTELKDSFQKALDDIADKFKGWISFALLYIMRHRLTKGS